MKPVALQIRVNNEDRVVGKVFDVSGTSVFYRSYEFSNAFFKKWNALSFDARVAEFLNRSSVAEIHYEDRNGNLFVVSTSKFLSQSVEGNWGEGAQFYLPVSQWKITKRNYRVPWISDTRLIDKNGT